jgi:hypothetical protein
VWGDFEITLAYEVLDAKVVADGKETTKGGCGVLIWLDQGKPATEAASWGRHVFVGDDQPGYQAYRRSGPANGAAKHRREPFPGAPQAGRLQLVRKGSVLSFRAAQGQSTDYKEYFQDEFGTGDLSTIRFAASPGGKASAFDVRLLELQVRAEKLPGSPRVVEEGGMVLWATLLVAGGSVVILVLFILLRKRAAGKTKTAPQRMSSAK